MTFSQGKFGFVYLATNFFWLQLITAPYLGYTQNKELFQRSSIISCHSTFFLTSKQTVSTWAETLQLMS